MAIVKMQRITICALNKNRKAILERLQEKGLVELDIKTEQEVFYQDTVNARGRYLRHVKMAENALDILGHYCPQKTSVLDSLAGRSVVEKEEFLSIEKNRREELSKINALIGLDKSIAENKGQIQKLQVQREGYEPWKTLTVPMNFTGTKKTSFFIGTIPGSVSQENLQELLAVNAPEVEAVEMNIISVDKDYTYLALLCMQKDRLKTEQALRTAGFSIPSQLAAKTPLEMQEQLSLEMQELERKNQELEKKIQTYSGQEIMLKLTSDYYQARADKYEFLGKLPQTGNTFFIDGYVPKKLGPGLAEELEQGYGAFCQLSELKEGEEPPILLKNNNFGGAAEGVLASYGLPQSGEMDPSLIMMCCYVFLFGLMLSDAAYGLIVSVACGLALKKFPGMEENFKKSVRLFFWCGLSTLFWGIMFGGYFGDLVTVVARTFFGKEVTIPALWFVPLDNPMKMLMFAMLFGVIHLFLGLALKGYMCLRDGKYLDFVCDVLFWFFLLLGLIFMLLPTELFMSIAQAQIAFPAWVVSMAKWLAIVGALGILLMSGRSTKNPGVRIALGAYDLYNITGWISDVLSYSRLLALGLATGVIASVVNQMGSMAGGGIVGAILFIIVFLIGHTFNLLINLLGAYVHTCRLQYVEFFGKFYEGGGRMFEPFKMNTKYMKIKEEKQL